MKLTPKDGSFRAADSRVYSREKFAAFDRLSEEEKERWLSRAEGNYNKAVDLLFTAMEQDIRRKI